jgi:hypothetical protein
MAQVSGFDHHRFDVSRFEESVLDAHRLLIKAADQWAEGHAEEPPTIEVLNSILYLFESRKFLRLPYGYKRQNP